MVMDNIESLPRSKAIKPMYNTQVSDRTYSHEAQVERGESLALRHHLAKLTRPSLLISSKHIDTMSRSYSKEVMGELNFHTRGQMR
jgi:hypothetical protein